MIKSIKASSDCLFLRLPFEFSRAQGDVFALIVSGLYECVCVQEVAICALQVCFHPSDISTALKTLSGGQSTVNLNKHKLSRSAGMIVLVQF